MTMRLAEFAAISCALNGLLIGILLIVLIGDRGHVPFALPIALAIACGLGGHRFLTRGRASHA
ncbi:MAG: hypothetical protein ACRYG4_01265 [Janthinobacterium lividum]